MRRAIQSHEAWIWGGSLVLTVLTRQIAFGLVPLALAHGRWQRQQWEQRLVEHSNRWEQQWERWLVEHSNRWEQQWRIQQHQIFQRVEQHLQSVQPTPAPLVHSPQPAVDAQVTQLLAEVGSLAEQVKQLQEQPRSHLSIQQQMAPLVQRLHLLQEDWQRLKLQALPHLEETQQQLQKQLNQVQSQIDKFQQQLEKLQQQQAAVSSQPCQDSIPPRRAGVGVFIDGANLHASARDLGVSLDYESLIPRLLGSSAKRAQIHFYSGWDPKDPQQKAFHEYLEQLGFHLHRKPVVHFANGGSKANMDGEMIVDMLVSRYGRVILLSGDGDFLRALQHLQSQGVQVEVAAFGQHTQWEMRRQFPFVELSRMLDRGREVIPLPAKQVPSA
ncbi:NYN domain-containing protein [Thermostichus vulcanus]|uniref:NYN domain-containing protein n=1 Tax=Thermostichus vulcanus str. 'Rupite' TaxID=2813851 RepID=A0ABT0C9F4_THEVL|nr:NYN domain-containing protein [Thermostichus vulcanus]MCJ2542418.1 NYN domain-containing protein [Thermostichus vulcanus str. 'Rupite']